MKVSKNGLTGQQTLQILMYWIMGQHSGQQQLAQKEAALAESEQKTIRQRALYEKEHEENIKLRQKVFEKDLCRERF